MLNGPAAELLEEYRELRRQNPVNDDHRDHFDCGSIWHNTDRWVETNVIQNLPPGRSRPTILHFGLWGDGYRGNEAKQKKGLLNDSPHSWALTLLDVPPHKLISDPTILQLGTVASTFAEKGDYKIIQNFVDISRTVFTIFNKATAKSEDFIIVLVLLFGDDPQRRKWMGYHFSPHPTCCFLTTRHNTQFHFVTRNGTLNLRNTELLLRFSGPNAGKPTAEDLTRLDLNEIPKFLQIEYWQDNDIYFRSREDPMHLLGHGIGSNILNWTLYLDISSQINDVWTFLSKNCFIWPSDLPKKMYYHTSSSNEAKLAALSATQALKCIKFFPAFLDFRFLVPNGVDVDHVKKEQVQKVYSSLCELFYWLMYPSTPNHVATKIRESHKDFMDNCTALFPPNNRNDQGNKLPADVEGEGKNLVYSYRKPNFATCT